MPSWKTQLENVWLAKLTRKPGCCRQGYFTLWFIRLATAASTISKVNYPSELNKFLDKLSDMNATWDILRKSLKYEVITAILSSLCLLFDLIRTTRTMTRTAQTMISTSTKITMRSVNPNKLGKGPKKIRKFWHMSKL